MDFPGEMKHVYDDLSLYNRKFLRFVESRDGGLERKTYKDLSRINDYLFTMQPWPVFLSAGARDAIGSAAVKVFDLIKSIPLRVFGGDYQKMSAYYEIPVDMIAYFLDGFTQAHLDNLVARGDFVMSPQGLKCIEFNVNTNLGGLDSAFWLPAYLSVPLVRDFLKQEAVEIRNPGFIVSLFDFIIDDFLERYPSYPGEINIAYVIQQGSGGMDERARQAYLEAMLNKALDLKRTGLKGNLVVCDYSRLSVSGDAVSFQGRPIHVLFESYLGYVPSSFVRAFKAGNVLLYNGAASWLMSTKLNLALLSELENDGVFSPAEQETIKNHIPWTRKVTPGFTTYKREEINLPEFIVANRERLVLKPLVGSGGKDVYIGANTAPGEWEQVLEKTLRCTGTLTDIPVDRHMDYTQWQELMEKALNMERWLVQEYAPSYPFVFQHGEKGYSPHNVAWGFFVFGKRFAGGWARILPNDHKKGVVNAHQGAESILIFDVDE